MKKEQGMGGGREIDQAYHFFLYIDFIRGVGGRGGCSS